MKKLLLVLFAAGLIAVFSMPAVAADVKFFGDYYVMGLYESNHSLRDGDVQSDPQKRITAVGQRLRINTVFQVAEGLKLTTRFDAMERMWGKEQAAPNRTVGGNGGTTASPQFVELDKAEKNISWERAYVTFNLGPGFFDVGYQADGYWSPIAFGNTTGSGPMIRYTSVMGPMTLSIYAEKGKEEGDALGQNAVYNNAPGAAAYLYGSSGDKNTYALQGTFKWKSGQAGLQLIYDVSDMMNNNYQWLNPDDPTGGVAFTNATVKYWEVSPFFQAKLGPVDLEGKLYYDYGKVDYRLKTTARPDVDIRGLSYYANGKVNIGPAYVGAFYAYIQGDNDQRAINAAGRDKIRMGHNGGQDWDPALILGNDRYTKWTSQYRAPSAGFAGSPFTAGFEEGNIKFIQGYVGVKPIPTLEIKAAFTNARLDYTTNNSNSKDVGNELDITATYKIYPNLEYMVGFGYLWTGDYYKGNIVNNSSNRDIDNDYLLMHQLTLTF